MAPSVTYLSHRIESEGLHPTEVKIRASRDTPTPRNMSGLKAFLGWFQFYSRYVPNVADKLGSLYHLLQKGVSWKLETDHSLAFQQEKESLWTNRVLVHYDPPKKLFSLVILISTAWEQFYLILCKMVARSQLPMLPLTLSAAERNYCLLDKEGRASIFGVKKIPPVPAWTNFPDRYGSQATRQSFQPDSLDSLPPRIIRWYLLMSSYDYSIMHKTGTNIVTADAMCRLPQQENLQVPTLECIIHLMDHLDDTTVDSADIRRHTSKDPVLSKDYQAVWSGTNLPKGPLYSAFYTKRYELSVENGCLLWGSRVIIPHILRQQVLKELH